MTLNAITLDEYFHKIINQPRIVEIKELTMFDKLKKYFTDTFSWKEPEAPKRSSAYEEAFKEIQQSIADINPPVAPVAFVETEDPTLYEDGYWAFEMYTPAWINEHGEKVEPVHTVLVEPNEGTWMEVLDTVLDAMEAHYGYNIKEQVYYSVNFPLNQSDLSGYGRCLNDERLQQILLAFPELYLSGGWGDNTQREAMFK
jgi:hypothetical protein